MRLSWVTSRFFFGLMIGALVVCAASITFLLVRDRDGSQSDRQDSSLAQFDELDRGDGYVNESEIESLLESGGSLERRFLSMAPLERMLAIADHSDNFNEKGLRKLVDIAEDFDSSILRDELQDVAIRKLTSINPRRALKLIASLPEERHSSLVRAVFQELSAVDLDQAVSEAHRLDDKLKHSAVKGILTARKDLAAEDRLKLARELDSEQLFHELVALELIEKRIDDPAGKWGEFVQEYGTDLESLSDSQRAALLHVAKSWVIRDGLRAVEAINSSFLHRESRTWLTQQLLTTLVSQEPVLARTIVEDLREENRAILLEVVQLWADEDGLGAFKAAQWMDDLGTDDTTRMQLAAIDGWARSNPHTLMTNLRQLPERLQEFSQNTALLEMRWTSPESVPAFIEDVGNLETQDWLSDNLIDGWMRYDPHAAFRWAMEYEKTTGKPRGYSRSALRTMARIEFEEALSIALELPLDENGIGREATVIGVLGKNKALELIGLARNPATRLSVHIGIGGRLLNFDDYEGLLTLVEDEPIDAQLEYFEYFARQIASKKPQFLIEKFDSLPNKAFKQHCSVVLLMYNSLRTPPFLSEEDVEKFEKFTNEDGEDD